MIRLRTLGESSIEIESTRIGAESVVLFGFIVYLAMQDGRPVSRARLRELFWPHTPEPKASHALRQVLYRLRRLNVELEVTPTYIRLDRRDVSLDLDTPLGAAPNNGGNGSATRAPVFLDGYAPRFSTPFSEWLEEQRGVVHARLRADLLSAVASSRSRGDWAGVDRTARMCLAIDPLNEQATLALAEARALSGSKAEAVAILDRYTREIAGDSPGRSDLPSIVLRRRIAERLVDAPFPAAEDGSFVGRADAMAMLTGLLQRVRRGIGETIFLVGEAGIGKTRLLEEIARVAVMEGVRVVRLGCRPEDRERPLGLFVELVPRLLKLRGAAGCTPESIELLSRFSDYRGSSGTPSEAAEEAEVLAARLRRAIDDLVSAVTGERAVLLIVDDVQWIDRASWELLMGVAHRSTERTMGLVCASRQRPPETGVTLRVHQLPPLSDEAAGTLLRDLLSVSEIAYEPDTFSACLQFARGNPFWLRELAAHWRTPATGGALPQSLEHLIARRLDTLGGNALRALQLGGMLGRHATIDRVRAILQLSNYAFLQAVDELGESGLATTSGECIEAHDLVIERTLCRFSETGLRAAHAIIAARLESEITTTDSPSLMWECWRHLDASGARDRAIPFVQSCASHLLELGVPEKAVELIEKTLARCEVPAERLRLLDSLVVALHISTRWKQLVEAVSLREKVRTELGIPTEGHPDDELLLLEALWRVRDDADEVVRRCLACAEDSSASPSHRLSAATLGLLANDAYFDQAMATRIISSVDPIIGLVPDSDRREVLTFQVVYHTTHGDLDTAFECAQALIGLDRQLAHPARLARTLRYASWPARMVGRRHYAEAWLREALAIAEAYTLTPAIAATLQLLASHALACENVEAAKVCLKQAESIGASDSQSITVFGLPTLAATVCLREGRLEDARIIMDPILDRLLSDRRTRVRNCGLEFALRYQLLSGDNIDRSLVTQLCASHIKSRQWGLHDEETETLVRCLRRSGDERLALALLAEYVLVHRRERTPLPSPLSVLCNELGVASWQDAPG